MNEDVYKKLVALLKLFKNRPYHLAKYLADNSALTKDFMDKLLKSDKLKTLSEENDRNLPILFLDISQMEEYFNSFIDFTSIKDKDIEQLTTELNLKLDELIKNENFEEAAAIRDYMVSKGIKRTNKF